MKATEKEELKFIGRVENVAFPELEAGRVLARIDTGARLTSVWATSISEHDGTLSFALFGPSSPYYSGTIHTTKDYEQIAISSSMGHVQKRYRIKILVKIKGKKIRTSVTLSDRSTQVYPVLIGRNVLRGKFVVDVLQGRPARKRERESRLALQAALNNDKVK